MSILFCTPCYGGMITTACCQSMLKLSWTLDQAGVEHDFNFGVNESLVQRARNKMSAAFMKTSFRKLMFIDADIEFEPEGVAKLWNLDADVACGVYPMKRKDCPLGAWKGGMLITKLPAEPFEVDYAGTGFMMIDRGVFEKFREAFPERAHDEGDVEKCFAWFHPRVEDGIYWSEDYAFARDWRSLGGKIIADPAIKLTHYGLYGYGAEEAGDAS